MYNGFDYMVLPQGIRKILRFLGEKTGHEKTLQLPVRYVLLDIDRFAPIFILFAVIKTAKRNTHGHFTIFYEQTKKREFYGKKPFVLSFLSS